MVLGFYIFFIVGLAMVSMCVSLLQIRMENKYMAALQMIDEEHRAMVEGVVDDDMTIAPTTAPGSPGRNEIPKRSNQTF